MALAVATLTNGSDNDGGASATTASITPTADALVLIDIINIDADFSAPASISSVTGNGLTWELVSEQVVSIIRLSRFRTLGASPSTGAITITAPVNQFLITWFVHETTGVDTSGTNGSGAIVQTVTNTGTGTTISATLAAFGSANNMANAGMTLNSDSSFTEGSGYTVIHETTGFLSEYQVNDTSVDATIAASRTWIITASEIKEAVAATKRRYSLTLTGVG